MKIHLRKLSFNNNNSRHVLICIIAVKKNNIDCLIIVNMKTIWNIHFNFKLIKPKMLISKLNIRMLTVTCCVKKLLNQTMKFNNYTFYICKYRKNTKNCYCMVMLYYQLNYMIKDIQKKFKIKDRRCLKYYKSSKWRI